MYMKNNDSEHAKSIIEGLYTTRNKILSDEIRDHVRKYEDQQYTDKIKLISSDFVHFLIMYVNNILKYKIYRMVLYTGSLIYKNEEHRMASYYPVTDFQDDLWPDITKRFTESIFTRDSEVRHILTEAIWRFKGNFCPVVFIGSDAVGSRDEYQYPHKIVIPYWKMTRAKYDEANILLNIEVGSDFNNVELWNVLYSNTKIMNAVIEASMKLNEIPKKNIEGERFVYNESEIKRIFAHVIYDFNMSKQKYGTVSERLRNIYYIPDSRPGPVSGGAVIVFDSGDERRLPREQDIFILQSIISDFYLANIATVESERFVLGRRKSHWRYREKYFINSTVQTNFVEEILSSCIVNSIPEDFRDDLHSTLKEIFGALNCDHLLLIGYEEISARIFAGICKLWNFLGAESIVNKFTEFQLRSIEQDVTNFEKFDIYDGKKGSPFLRLLYKALNFENSLMAIPSYRDHFIHSFHVFCLGIWVVAKKIMSVDGSCAWTFTPTTLKQWFYASMMHDMGYSLEKIEDLADTFIYSMVEHKGIRPIIPIKPHWGCLSLIKEIRELFMEKLLNEYTISFIKRFADKHIHHNKTNEKLLDEKLVGDMGVDRIFRIAFDFADHGIISGLLVYHAMKSYMERRTFNLEELSRWQNTMENLFPSIFASIVHQCCSWKWKWPGIEDSLSVTDEGAKVLLSEIPIAHLLILCDTLAQFGREFDILSSANNSFAKTIKLSNMGDMSSVDPFILIYDNWDKILFKNEIIANKYYASRYNVLSNYKLEDENIKYLYIEIKFQNPPQAAKCDTISAYPIIRS